MAKKAKVQKKKSRPRRTRAPDDLTYEQFVKLLPKITDPSRVKAAYQLLKKRSHEISYRTPTDQIYTVWQPDPKTGRTYIGAMNGNAEYQCATSKIKACGGLKGNACKHSLASTIALVKYGIVKPSLACDNLTRCCKWEPDFDPKQITALYDYYQKGGWKKLKTNSEDFA